MKVNNFRQWSLALAEQVDAWRLAPRLLVGLYGVLVYYLVDWFWKIPTYIKTSCDANVLKVLLDKNVDITIAQDIACSAIDVIGGPTAAQTTIVGIVVGLATAIFGLYANSGKDWSKSVLPWRWGKSKNDVKKDQILEENEKAE